MKQWVKLRLALRAIEKAKGEISSRWDAAVRDAKAQGKSKDEIHDLGYPFHMEHVWEDEEVLSLTSDYYIRLANRLLVPVPKYVKENGDWEESLTNGSVRLTAHALHELRKSIREETKSRREQWMIWFSLIFGAIGAVSGLVALTLTKSTIELNRYSIEVSHRPFVTVKALSLENALKINALPNLKLYLHNTGSSPALALKTFWTIRFTDTELNGGLMPPQDLIPKSVAVLPSNVEITVPFESKKVVTDELATALKEHRIRIYVFGRIAYEDIFGAHHLTEYCFEPDPVTGTGTACAHWNTLN